MPPKRAHGEGSLSQLPSGKWRARVSVDGRRLSHTADRKEQAAAWIRKTTRQIERGMNYDATIITLAEYLDSWLASKKAAIRQTTYSAYKTAVHVHLIPALGELRMADLRPDLVQAAYDGWLAAGKSAGTVKRTHAVLRQALDRAERTGLLVRNPARLVVVPRVERPEMQFWTEGQAGAFLAAAREDRHYALFHLALVTGARQGELLGLKWEDLDWSRGTLKISRQLTRSRELAPLKTRAGNRTLELGEGTIAVLREHDRRQQLERRVAGRRWQEHGLIFTTTIGTGIYYKNLVERHFKPLIEAAGVPEIRFHDLRHTAVAIMLSRGLPIFTVSRWIGHARASITSDVYGHLQSGATAGIGQMMDDLVAPVPVELPIGHELDTKSENG